MSRRLKQAAVVFVLALAAAQLVRPARVNPLIEPSRTIGAQSGATSGLVAVLDRSCSECHSNDNTAESWYTKIAPLSWLMASGVTEGRKAVNFSEWSGYSPQQQRDLLAASCQDASEGKMPGRPYTLLRPEARLSATDIETICAAARRTEANAATETGPQSRREQ
jgi:heme-binding protein